MSLPPFLETPFMLNGDLIKYGITLLAITNPIGNVAIFIGLTSNKTDLEKRKIALQTAIASLITLIIVTWAGESILKLFSISIPAFQIAGGLVITLVGLSMLSSKKSDMLNGDEYGDKGGKDSIAVVPMTIPIIVGPATMTTVIIYMGQAHDVFARVGATVIDFIIGAIIALTLCFSGNISRFLGNSGIKIATRVMGLILVAMAMSMIIAGMQTAFPGLVQR